MKTKTFIFVSFALLMFTLSCSKRERILPTTVKGQVRTVGTEDPIVHPPVRVRLYLQVPQSGWNTGVGYVVVDETMTDENQNFVLNGNLDDSKIYYLGVAVESISEAHHYLPVMYLDFTRRRPDWQLQSIGGTVHQNFYMLAKGWVNFHFLSENPQPGDLFGYNAGGGASEIFSGAVDIERIIDFAGNSEHRVAFNLKRFGNWNNWQKDIFVPAFDTIDIQIKF
jgi:hypothetical protein